MTSPLPSAPPRTTHVLYLHGFRSSPQSAKAQLVLARLRGQHPQVLACCPQLPPSPGEATRLIRQLTASWPADHSAVIGSSLGGFYARWLALTLPLRAVLLNPAPHPARSLAQQIGEQRSWHDPAQRFCFEARHVQELVDLEQDIERLRRLHPTTPERLLALITEGDEVLDWREMQAFAAGGTAIVLPGGDHAISDFDQHLDRVLAFLHLA